MRWRLRGRAELLAALVLAVVLIGWAARAASVDPVMSSRTVRAAVALRPLAVDIVVGPDDFDWRELPATMVPASATTEADPSPVGRAVVSPIEAGEPLARSRLAPDGVRGLAALVPPGQVALAVAVDEHMPPLDPGQRVDLYAREGPAPAAGETGEAAARAIVTGASVVSVDDRRVLVAMPRADAAAVSAALLDGLIAVALVGPP